MKNAGITRLVYFVGVNTIMFYKRIQRNTSLLSVILVLSHNNTETEYHSPVIHPGMMAGACFLHWYISQNHLYQCLMTYINNLLPWTLVKILIIHGVFLCC